MSGPLDMDIQGSSVLQPTPEKMDTDQSPDQSAHIQDSRKQPVTTSDLPQVLPVTEAGAVVDQESGFPLDTLTFALHVILPTEQIVGDRIQSRQKQVKDLTDKEFSSEQDSDIILHGHLFEGFDLPALSVRQQERFWANFVENQTRICKSSDVDYTLLAVDNRVGYQSDPNGTELQHVIDDSIGGPGFVALKIIDPSLPQHDSFKHVYNGCMYLSSTLVWKDFQNGLQEGFDLTGICVPGRTKFQVSALNLAFPCKSWPRSANEWITRRRPFAWPSPEVIQKVKDEGCCISPKVNKRFLNKKTDKPDMETKKLAWQFFFPAAEKHLAESFNKYHFQVQGLVLFLLNSYRDSTDPDEVAVRSMVKNSLYWLCEEIPPTDWAVDNIGKLYLSLVNKLLEGIKAGQLAHYMIRERNLVEETSPEVLDKLKDYLQKARKEPLACLLEELSKVMSLYHPATVTINTLLQPVFADTLNDPSLVREQRRMQVLANIAQEWLYENKDFQATQLLHHLQSLGAGEAPLVGVLQFVNDLPQAEQLFEALPSVYPGGQLPASYKCGQAFLMFVRAYSEEPPNPELLQTAKTLFEASSRDRGRTVVAKLDYATFLYKIKQDHEIQVQLLEEIIAQEGNSLAQDKLAVRRYLPQMKAVLDDAIVKEFDPKIKEIDVEYRLRPPTIPFVTVPCIINACYLLVNVLVEMDKFSEARQVLKHFLHALYGIKEEFKDARFKTPVNTFFVYDHFRDTINRLYYQAAKTAKHYRAGAELFLKILEGDTMNGVSIDNVTECVTAMKEAGEDAEDLETLLNKYVQDKEKLQQFHKEDLERFVKFPEQQAKDIQERQIDKALKSLVETARSALQLMRNGKTDEVDQIKMKMLELCQGQDPENVLSSRALRCEDTRDSVTMYEYIIEAYPESARLHSHKSNLACMYHALSKKVAADEQGEWIAKSRSSFEEAVTSENATSSTRMDFGCLLHDVRDYDTLLPILEQIIGTEKDRVVSGNLDGNSYGLSEKDAVEESIGSEIEARNGEVSIASIHHAYYIKLKVLRETDKPIQDLEQVMDGFVTAVKELPTNNSYQEMAWVLLGYAANQMSQFDLATQAFTKVLEVAPKNVLAEENLQMSMAMQMSLNPQEDLMDYEDGEIDDEDDEDDDETQAEETVDQKIQAEEKEHPRIQTEETVDHKIQAEEKEHPRIQTEETVDQNIQAEETKDPKIQTMGDEKGQDQQQSETVQETQADALEPRPAGDTDDPMILSKVYSVASGTAHNDPDEV